MEELNKVQVDSICRSCMNEKSEMLSLFTMYKGPVSTCVNAVPYSGMLMASAAVSVCEGDGLPGNICDQCKDILVQSYHFKNMCEQTDARLRAYKGLAARSKDVFTQTDESKSFQSQYNCSECEKKFKTATALQRHCKHHVQKNSMACDSCGNLYKDADALRKHMMKSHRIKDTKVEDWDEDREDREEVKVYPDQETKKEPTRILVKEEPMDVYHDEDDANSDYLFSPIKEELQNEQVSVVASILPIEHEKKKTFKKKNKKNLDVEALPENHPCSTCPRVFSTKSHLEVHEAKHAARAQRYKCPSCDKSFGRSSHLKRHQLLHSSEGVEMENMCPHCSKSFTKSEDLEKHIQNKHRDGENCKNPKVAFCNLCERGFTTQRYLEIHMRSHQTPRGLGEQQVNGFPCKSCEHVSENKVEAKAHTQWHRRAERPFLCSECGQGFTRDAYLTVHMRRHRGEKPFSCSFCGKGFPRRSDLDIHERYHTEDKRHTCAICGKAFHRQYNLKVHLRVHTGERPYTCSYCPKAFTQPNDLKAHVRRHTGERFTCEICSAPFLHGYHLTQHRRTVHAVDKPSHIRRLSKFPSAGPPHPPTEPHPPPTRGRARQAHIELAAHMASILAAQQQQQPPSLPLSQPPPAS